MIRVLLQSGGGTANPVRQIFVWGIEAMTQVAQQWSLVSNVLALLLVGLLIFVTVRRVRGSGEDPNFTYSSESDAGATSISVSGVHYVGMLAVAVAALTWPAPVESPVVLLALGGIVLAHWIVEKRERDAI